jgi:hypothetical protein
LDVNAAISSRKPGLNGDGPRITACVNAESASVAAGLKANKCMICEIFAPDDFILWINPAYGPPGFVLFSTLCRYMGFIV